jgi:hypothetical protein
LPRRLAHALALIDRHITSLQRPGSPAASQIRGGAISLGGDDLRDRKNQVVDCLIGNGFRVGNWPKRSRRLTHGRAANMPCGNVASGCRSATVDSSSNHLYRYFGYVRALARGFVQLAAYSEVQFVIVQFNGLRLVRGFL